MYRDPAVLEPPFPPRSTRERSQLEAFMVLRRNPLELWGPRAYREMLLPGRFFGRNQLLLNHPEHIHHVLVANAANYRRNAGTERVLRPIVGDGLFLAEGEDWRHRRRTIAPAMAPRSLSLLGAEVVRACAEQQPVLDALAHRPIELLPRFQHLALSIAGRSMFSLEMAQAAPRLRALLMNYALHHAKVGVLDLLLPRGRSSPADRGRARFRAEWLAFIAGLIRTRDAAPPTDAPRDLFDLLRAARDPETHAPFTEEELADEVATLIVAGHETTAVTLFWSAYLLARAPDTQEALAAEALAADLSPAHATAALPNLPLMRAHIEETLRLYPPAFLIVREAVAADRVGDTQIAPGTVISIAPWILHRHEAFWPNPNAYDPARFAPTASRPPRHAYLPFGAGPRICVGAQFALTEAILAQSHLLRHHRLSLAGPDTMHPRALVTTQPDRPVWFTLDRR